MKELNELLKKLQGEKEGMEMPKLKEEENVKKERMTKEKIMNLVEEKLREYPEKNIETFIFNISDGKQSGSIVYGKPLDIGILIISVVNDVIEKLPDDLKKVYANAFADSIMDLIRDDEEKIEKMLEKISEILGDK